MQLGARWLAGSPPHPGVPEALHPLLAEVEVAHPGARSWTLTWLEGRPRCELECAAECPRAAAPIVTLTADGAPALVDARTVDSATGDLDDLDDDDWLT